MDLKIQIPKKIEEKNYSKNYPYVLSVSIGTASGICLNFDDIEKLLRIADEAMYAEKKQSKNKGVKRFQKYNVL